MRSDLMRDENFNETEKKTREKTLDGRWNCFNCANRLVEGSLGKIFDLCVWCLMTKDSNYADPVCVCVYICVCVCVCASMYLWINFLLQSCFQIERQTATELTLSFIKRLNARLWVCDNCCCWYFVSCFVFVF